MTDAEACTMCENIEFVRRRDGAAAAGDYAAQAKRQYRRALLETKRNGGRLIARRLMIAAYLCACRRT